MADEFSFDVVSKIDLQELENAVNQVNKEITTRFDFRGSVSRLEFDKKAPSVTMFSDDEGKLKSVVDIFQNKCIKRNVSWKAMDLQKLESAEKATVRQLVKVKQGLSGDQAKEIVKHVKDAKLKVTASIQGEQVRVASKSKDELQATMNHIKMKDFGADIQFINYR